LKHLIVNHLKKYSTIYCRNSIGAISSPPKCPRPLQKGDRVAIIAPASPVDSAALKIGLKVIQDMGLQPVLGKNITHLKTDNLLAAPLKDRVEELIWAFSDSSIAGIIVATGGFGCAQLLPHLPYDLIRSNCKVFLGFSDVTALNCALLKKSEMVSFNGPSAAVCIDSQEQINFDRIGLKDAINLLMRQSSWGSAPFKRNPMIVRCVSPGTAQGQAVGGNLATLTSLIGTPYFPDVEGAILFLEDIRAGGYEVLQRLTHLKLAGILDKIAGVVIGEFVKSPDKIDSGDPSINDVIVETFSNGPPCVVGFNFNHGDIGACIPIGSSVSLDADARKVFFKSPLDPELY